MALVVVGACTFPDYTLQGPPVGVGGFGGSSGTTDVSTTGLGDITSMGTPTGSGSDTASTTTGAGAGGSGGGGGSGGENLAGSAGEGVDAGSEFGGIGGTMGGAGSVTSSSSGDPGGSGGDTGSGGTGGVGQCGNNDQCLSQQCDDGWCRAPHCGNDAADELETDTDCGGPDCRPCGYDEHCLVDADCATLDCSSAERCQPTVVVNCHCNSAGACNETPQTTVVDIQLWNPGMTPIAFDDLQFRYFYSGQESGTDQVRCEQANFANGGCSVFAAQARSTAYGDPTASHEVAFQFSSGTLAGDQTTGPIRFSIHSNGPYQRGDDYSFQGAPTSTSEMPAACENIVVLNADGLPIWGILPE